MSGSTRGAARDPLLAGRLLDYWWTLWKRTWRGSLISSFVTPLLYVLAMGVFLGRYVEADPSRLEGAPTYLAFVVPGLVASQVMQVAVGEMTYPVMGMIKWHRTYYGMIATPLSVRDVVVAQLVMVAARFASVAAVFLLVVAPFGVYASLWGALGALATCVLVGVAFAAPLFALSARLKDESGFSLVFRLGMIPLFLFSGAFFPITNLDLPLQWLARITPLWHGVDLARMLTLGTLSPGLALVHVAYLVVMAVGGYLLAVRLLERRLML